MTLYGPDLSNNNWNSASEIVGWLDDCFHREGYSWLEHKVSEGNYYADPYWPTVRDWCENNGVPCIGYHYVTTNDAAQQAAKFVNNGGGKLAMLDFEANSGDIGNFWAVVNAFNTAGVQVSLSYIPHWYWQNIGSPSLAGAPGLISSSYYETGTYGSTEYVDAGGDAGPGWSPYGGVTPIIWQFSDGAVIDGKSVDANAFKGSEADLAALLGSSPPQPSGEAVTNPTDPTTQLLQSINAALTQVLAIVSDNQIQERGPGLRGWPQLDDRTIVDALAAIGQKLQVGGFSPPQSL